MFSLICARYVPGYQGLWPGQCGPLTKEMQGTSGWAENTIHSWVIS